MTHCPDTDTKAALSGRNILPSPGGSLPDRSTSAATDLYQLFFEKSGDGALIVQNNTIVGVNQSLADMCQYTIEELINRPLSMLSVANEPTFTPAAVGTENQTRPPNDGCEFNLRRKDGSKLKVVVEEHLMDHINPKTVLLLAKRQGESTRTEFELQKMRQLESIAALSGGIAHDYNNLLAVILGNISLIQSYIDPQDIIYRLLNEVYNASMTAKALTRQLITFAKGGAPRKTACDLAALLRSVTEFSLSGANIKCRYDISDDLFLVDIDKTQVSQALHNLIMNARESMPDGGTITVAARNVTDFEGEPEIVAVPCVKLSVVDQGSGIPLENLERIFDPYFSTKERGNQKGTGLGLSICHSIIGRHDGAVTAASTVGQGTTVCVFLPASAAKVVTMPAEEPAETGLPVPGNGRILIMDDEEMIVKMAGRILARLGYETASAASGEEAVALYREALLSGRRFDAVILDLTVRGGMGGQEAIRHLLQIDPLVKAIVSSGYSDSPVMNRWRDFGFCGVVVKPYSLLELSRTLNKVLFQAQTLQPPTDGALS